MYNRNVIKNIAKYSGIDGYIKLKSINHNFNEILNEMILYHDLNEDFCQRHKFNNIIMKLYRLLDGVKHHTIAVFEFDYIKLVDMLNNEIHLEMKRRRKLIDKWSVNILSRYIDKQYFREILGDSIEIGYLQLDYTQKHKPVHSLDEINGKNAFLTIRRKSLVNKDIKYITRSIEEADHQWYINIFKYSMIAIGFAAIGLTYWIRKK